MPSARSACWTCVALGEVGRRAGRRGVAEVAAAIGVELGEAAKVLHHMGQRGKGGGGAFLRPEARVENRPRIIERTTRSCIGSPGSQAWVDASRWTSMPTSGRRSRLRR